MCATKEDTKQNYGSATEKYSGATTNLYQENPCVTSGIISVTIHCCTIYHLLYQEFLIVCAYP